MASNLVRAAQPQIRKSAFPLYDTVKLGGSGTINAQTIRLFQNGQGSLADGFTTAPGKTAAETNLARNGGLPLGQSYLVRSFGVSIWASDISGAPSSSGSAFSTGYDVEQIARDAVVSYTSGALKQTYGPAIMFPAGFGIVGQQLGNDSTSSTGTTDFYGGSINNNGFPASGARYRLSEPIILTDGQSFSWEVEFPEQLTLLVTSGYYRLQIGLFGESFQEVTQ